MNEGWQILFQIFSSLHPMCQLFTTLPFEYYKQLEIWKTSLNNGECISLGIDMLYFVYG
jgi:hypothetical protein